jgi:hypothetical protein
LTIVSCGSQNRSASLKGHDVEIGENISLTGRRYVGKVLYVTPRGEAYIDEFYTFTGESTVEEDSSIRVNLPARKYEFTRNGRVIQFYEYRSELITFKFSADYEELVSPSGVVYKFVKPEAP